MLFTDISAAAGSNLSRAAGDKVVGSGGAGPGLGFREEVFFECGGVGDSAVEERRDIR
jgi:hypothetical protein